MTWIVRGSVISQGHHLHSPFVNQKNLKEIFVNNFKLNLFTHLAVSLGGPFSEAFNRDFPFGAYPNHPPHFAARKSRPGSRVLGNLSL